MQETSSAITKYILLDVDGVLHPLNDKHLPKCANPSDIFKRVEEEDEAGDSLQIVRVLNGEFIPEAMNRLRLIVQEAAAHGGDVSIILSSTWRETAPGRNAVNDQLKRHGIQEIKSWTRSLYTKYRCKRAHEIVQWIIANCQADSHVAFVVLDDDDLCEQERPREDIDPAALFVLPHFVRTAKSSGLTEQDVLRVSDMLSNASAISLNSIPAECLMEFHHESEDDEDDKGR
jgi:hypothetical protein